MELRLCAGWQPQGSAWKRYVAQASDAAAAFRGFGAAAPVRAGQAQPAASAPPDLPTGQLPEEPASLAAPAGSTAALAMSPRGFPLQLSLERLQAERHAPLRQDEAGTQSQELACCVGLICVTHWMGDPQEI